MRNMIAADVRRTVRKKSFWVFIAAVLIFAIVQAVRARSVWNGFHFMSNELTVLTTGNLLFGLAVFFGVYVDEFRSRAMQCMIGRGLSRMKIILAKFLDCVILLLAVYLCFALFLWLMSVIMGADMTATESAMLYVSVFFAAAKTLLYITIAAFFLYATGSTPAGVVTLLLLYIGVSMVSDFVAGTKLGRLFHPEQLLADVSLTESLMNKVLVGEADLGGIFSLLIWLFFAVLLAFLVFRKKELEF